MNSLRGASKRVWIGALGAALLIGFSAWSYCSPWIAVSRLESAAMRGDKEEIERLVDFDAVRQRLALDMATRATSGLGVALDSGAGQAAYATFSVVASALVTPEGLTKAAREMGKAKSASPSGSRGAQKSSPPVELTGRYVNVGRFALVIAAQGSSVASEAVVIQFRRLGPVSWRVDRLVIPQIAASAKKAAAPAS